MAPSSEAPRDLADRVIRQALQHPANLRAFLHQAVPALAGGFDCERGRLLEREFPLDDWRRREAGLPFEAPYRLGDKELWALVYVLIEHQSGEDPVPMACLGAGRRAEALLRFEPGAPVGVAYGAGSWQKNSTLARPARRAGGVPWLCPAVGAFVLGTERT
jgi:hypothetical protein